MALPKYDNRKLRLLSYIVIAYMLLAFSWWSVLLFTKNKDAFYAKRDLLKIGMIAQDMVQSEGAFLQTPQYQQLFKTYRRQEWMIFGESAVFVITLIIGVYLINRGYHKEVKAADQRRNFLLSITHELKSPIASIKLVLETFLKRDLNKEQKEKFTQNALKETARLNSLVTDLLLSAKLENVYQPDFQTLALEEIIEETISKLEAKYSSATFTFDHKETLPTIEADKMGITSVAVNLLENAAKYGGSKPDVTTIVRMEDDMLRWQVADHGIGISDADKKYIFKKFYRVGSEETRTTKGTGLGLYIVKEIIEAHEGTIKVLDNTGGGTIFDMSIPIRQ